MKTYWISFKQNFTDYSEGHSLKEAVERLGMSLADVDDWKIISTIPLTPARSFDTLG